MPPAATRTVHPADRAVRAADGPEAVAVRSAFAAYAAGDDDSARQFLQAIGLSSPFLDWKLLVRGLIAHAAGDDTRAAENWRRLDPRRLPAKLVAPLQPTTPVAARQARKLPGGELAERLTKLRQMLGKGRPLAAAFAEAEAVVPPLRADFPHLLPRLAAAVGRAVRERGDRSDLGRLRVLFGPPDHDPDYHKLEALAYEDSRRHPEAVKHWRQYADWLGDAPWPPAVRRRARAVVLHRAAGLAPKSDAVALLQQAADLAPDWDAPADRLVKLLPPAEAEAVARRLLQHRPDHLPALDALAGLAADRPLDVLAVRRQALALNPLDAGRRAAAAAASVRAARTLPPADAARLLQADRAAGEDAGGAGFFVLRGLLAKKLGNAASAATDLDRAAADPDDRPAAALLAAVEAGLLKLTPGDKKPLAATLDEMLAGPLTPTAALRLAAAFDRLKGDGVRYRGSVGHSARIELLVTAAGPGGVADFEALGQGLLALKRWKLAGKLAAGWRRRFPLSPVFPLLEVEAEVAGGDRLLPYRLTERLREARRLAEASKELRHRALLDRIAELERAASPFDLFRTLFDEV